MSNARANVPIVLELVKHLHVRYRDAAKAEKIPLPRFLFRLIELGWEVYLDKAAELDGQMKGGGFKQ